MRLMEGFERGSFLAVAPFSFSSFGLGLQIYIEIEMRGEVGLRLLQ